MLCSKRIAEFRFLADGATTKVSRSKNKSYSKKAMLLFAIDQAKYRLNGTFTMSSVGCRQYYKLALPN